MVEPNDYLSSVRKQFLYYKHLGDQTFLQLNDEELFWKNDPEANSIAVIVNHLHGNMLSRWTEFLTTDGEKDFRQRDQEFENSISSQEDMLTKWEEGWQCLFTALDSVNASNIEQVVYIRNQGHSIIEAINRQLCHYSYHVGQIVFIGRSRRKSQWESLSIPKGQSKTYNAAHFSQEKKKTNFIDEILKKDKNS